MVSTVAALVFIAIDLWRVGDNAIVVGMAAAGVPVEQRRKVIFSVGAAIVLRIFFALITPTAGDHRPDPGRRRPAAGSAGRYRELRSHGTDEVAPDEALEAGPADAAHTKTLGAAIWQIADDVFDVALDTARQAVPPRTTRNILIIGLLLSVVLMGAAANMIAHLLHKHRWISEWASPIITYVAPR